MGAFKTAILEALVLVVTALGVALAANAVSDSGLKLSRDYFRRIQIVESAGAKDATRTPVVAAPAPADGPAATSTTSGNAAHDATAPRESSSLADESLTAEGLRVLSLAEVHDYSQYITEPGTSIVFVDARNDEAYRAGHIPGALQIDPWNENAYLPDVLPTLQGATMIVCYCGGGDCEDSIHLATRLVFDHGLPLENVYLFKGGWEEWTAAQYPVRTGDEP